MGNWRGYRSWKTFKIFSVQKSSVVLVYHIRAQHALVYVDTGNIIIGFKAKGNSIQSEYGFSVCANRGY